MVSPFAPHLGEECWRLLSEDAQMDAGRRGSGGAGDARGITFLPWVEWKEELCVSDMVTMGVQVNGKVRAQLELSKTASEEDARALAEAIPQVVKFTKGKEIKKFIYVPGRIISFVAK